MTLGNTGRSQPSFATFSVSTPTSSKPVSLDEAYLDVSENKLNVPFGHRVAKMIKSEVHARLRLTASAGVAPNKFLAKVASDLRKPDGLVVVMPGEVEEFLRPLVVEKIPGVGAVTRERLRGLEVDTIGQLANVPQEQLVHRFGKRGTYLFRLARGIDDDPVSPVREPKQLSSETTFASDLFDVTKMRSSIGDLCGELAQRLQRRRLRGRAVTLKARYPDFSTVTRSQTLPAELEGVGSDRQSRRGAPREDGGGVPRCASVGCGRLTFRRRRRKAGEQAARLVRVSRGGWIDCAPRSDARYDLMAAARYDLMAAHPDGIAGSHSRALSASARQGQTG